MWIQIHKFVNKNLWSIHTFPFPWIPNVIFHFLPLHGKWLLIKMWFDSRTLFLFSPIPFLIIYSNFLLYLIHTHIISSSWFARLEHFPSMSQHFWRTFPLFLLFFFIIIIITIISIVIIKSIAIYHYWVLLVNAPYVSGIILGVFVMFTG